MPLSKFECSVCGARCPREYLKHGKMKERMAWLRSHYAREHPTKFKRWGKK